MKISNDSYKSVLNHWTLEVFGLPVVFAAILACLDWLDWTWVSFGLGIFVYSLTCTWLIALQWTPNRVLVQVTEMLLSGAIILIFVFPYLCETIFQLWGSDAFVGDGPLSLSDWVWFMVENLGGILLLDMFDVYGIKLSRIEHNSTFWPSTLIFLFRTAVGFGVVSVALRSYGSVLGQITKESADKSV